MPSSAVRREFQYHVCFTGRRKALQALLEQRPLSIRLSAILSTSFPGLLKMLGIQGKLVTVKSVRAASSQTWTTTLHTVHLTQGLRDVRCVQQEDLQDRGPNYIVTISSVDASSAASIKGSSNCTWAPWPWTCHKSITME